MTGGAYVWAGHGDGRICKSGARVTAQVASSGEAVTFARCSGRVTGRLSLTWGWVVVVVGEGRGGGGGGGGGWTEEVSAHLVRTGGKIAAACDEC